MAFGVTAAGFEIKRLADIKGEIEDAIRASSEFGPGVNLEADSPLGQLVGIFAEREALLWELAQAIYNAAYPDTAEGAGLDNVCEVIGVTRLVATYSKVTGATLTGVAGTAIAAGSIVSVEGSGDRFTLDAPVTIGPGGTIIGDFTAEATGPIRANAGTLNQIETVIAGWTACTNGDDAVLGSDIETDSALRLRRLQSLQTIGAATVNAIYSRVLQQVVGVSDVSVVENDSDVTDSEGRPPHSVHCVVDGGTDQDVADKLWAIKAAGIATHGSTVVSVEDSQGYSHDVAFDRSSEVDIWFHVILSVTDDFDQGAKQKVVVTVDSVLSLYLYTTTVNGIVFQYTSDASATVLEIAAGLAAAVNAGSGANYVVVTATDNGDGTFDLEADYAGCPFTYAVPAELSAVHTVSNAGDQGAIIDAIVAYAATTQDIGVDVIRSRYFVPVNDASAETLSIDIRLAETPQPVATANIDILSNERASVDSSHVTVEITP